MRYDLYLKCLTYPCISAETVAPLLSIMASTSSTTSKYASLFAYFTPDLLQGTLDNWPDGNIDDTLEITKILAKTLSLHELSKFYLIINTHFDFPVTVLAMVLNIFGGFINSFKMLLSVARGKPLSNISSSN